MKEDRGARLFPAEIGWNLAPVLRIPFDEREGRSILPQPSLGSSHEGKQRLVLRRRRQRRLSLTFIYPNDGRAAVAVDGHGQSFLFQ